MVDFFALIGPVAKKVEELTELATIALDENNSEVARKFLSEAKKWDVAKKDVMKATHDRFGKLSPETEKMLMDISLLPPKPIVDMKKEMERMGLPDEPKETIEKQKNEKETMMEDIPILKKPVPYTPPKHSDDLDEGPIDLTSSEEDEFVKQAADKSFVLLLSFLRALSHIYQFMHWRSAGTNYYGDHLLYERLYNSTNDEIDPVAEKTLGITNDSSAINPIEDSKLTTSLITKFVTGEFNPESFSEIGIVAEKELIKLIEKMMAKGQSDGVENMLQGISDKHEGHLYLLQQRNKSAYVVINTLVKVAYNLDKEGKISEADRIDEMIKLLCERTGLKIADEDLISIANNLDSLGMFVEADQIDGLIKKAKCPQCGNHEFGDDESKSSICEDCGYPMVKLPREPGVKKMLSDKHKEKDYSDNDLK